MSELSTEEKNILDEVTNIKTNKDKIEIVKKVLTSLDNNKNYLNIDDLNDKRSIANDLYNKGILCRCVKYTNHPDDKGLIEYPIGYTIQTNLIEEIKKIIEN